MCGHRAKPCHPLRRGRRGSGHQGKVDAVTENRSYPSATWDNVLQQHDIPSDPGGDMMPERINILRARVAAFSHSTPFAFTPNHGGALLDALDEVETLRAALAARDADADIINRVLREIPWRGFWPFDRWPPSWLVEMVERGDADEMQMVRTRMPVSHDAPWYRHTVLPRGYDPTTHAAAKRVLARCKGRSP